MKLFSRRPPAPAVATRGLDKDERVLAWARATDGSYLVATPRGLHLSMDDETRLLGWHEISKAVWRDGQLTVTELSLVGDREFVDLPPWTVEFREPGAVPVILRQRVEASVGPTKYQQVSGQYGVRLVARKMPGVDGLHWQYRADPGVDTSSPPVHAAIMAAIEREEELSRPIDL